MKKQILLTALVIGALTAGQAAAAQAEDTETHQLDTVYVTGDKDNQAVLPGGFVSTEENTGYIGKKNIMKTPFTQTVFTEKTMNTFGGPDKPLDSVLVNSPSIRSAGSILHDDFLYRGFRTNGTNIYVNGVPGVMTQFSTPMYPFDKIELVSGPNSGLFGTGVQYESTNPGGIVSVESKKAPETPLMRYTQTFSGRGLFGEYLDIANRFGTHKEWGIRINTELLNGETSVKNAVVKSKGVSINIDHRTANSETNFLAVYRDLDIYKGLRWFLASGLTKLPKAAKGDTDLGYDGMVKAGYGWFTVFNHKQKLNEHWSAFINAGASYNKLNRNVMANGGSGYYLKDDGTFSVTSKPGATPQHFYYYQVGLNAEYETGALQHHITLAADQAWRNRDTAVTSSLETIGTGSIYSGITQWTYPQTAYTTRKNNKTKVKGFSLVDSVDYEKWNFIVGVHKHISQSDTYGTTGAISARVKSDATCPTYGITYRADDHVSVYGSHTENFDIGAVVPSGSNYINEGDILPPIKNKQNEIGVKYLKNRLLWTLAFYDIKQANNIIKAAGTDTSGNPLYAYVQDGELRHKGVELAVNGRIADKWNIMGGISYLSAVQRKTSKGALDGKQESGSSRWTGVTALEYRPNDAVSVIGRAVYTGKSPILNEKIWVPGYVVYDLGVEYKTHFGKTPVKLSVMCYNITDKDYWMASRGDNLYVSTPRTWTLSAQFDF